MGTTLFVGLVAVLAASVLGIVAVCSILDRDKPQLRPPLDREANPARKQDLLPHERPKSLSFMGRRVR
jgi:hypothetical protein